jgi:alpha-ketoglutarate-dependent taurine dioxygenase
LPGSPFDLADETAYRAWRDARLAGYPRSSDELVVPLADPRQLSASEFDALAACCARANMVIYDASHLPAADKALPHRLARQLGLVRLEGNYLADEDGLSSITPADDEGGLRGEFIPYTHKPINWHTDGYYNAPQQRILGMLLHCAQDAETGGENRLLDHELAYIQLRDANPEHVDALMQPDAMTIPARRDEHGVARPAQGGPVFAVDGAGGFLAMRYTARTRSIAWREDARTRAAVRTLAEILADSEHRLTVRLRPGMGLVCNNVLHTREAFADSPERRRLLYRGRYYDRLDFDMRPAWQRLE